MLIAIFAYLKQDPKRSTLYVSPELPAETEFMNNQAAFLEQYQGATEPMPHNLPLPHGQGHLTITAFVDTVHASNRVTRRSHAHQVVDLLESSPYPMVLKAPKYSGSQYIFQ